MHGERRKEVGLDETIAIHGRRTERVDLDEAVAIGIDRAMTVAGESSNWARTEPDWRFKPMPARSYRR